MLSLFVEYEFVSPNRIASSPWLFGTNGSEELDADEASELGALFDCVDINKLRVDDLRRATGLCLDLCEKAKRSGTVDMTYVLNFSERTLKKLVQFHNSIHNIPVELYERNPHRRSDILFTFSHRFHRVQARTNSGGPLEPELSPFFADQLVWANGQSQCISRKRAPISG